MKMKTFFRIISLLSAVTVSMPLVCQSYAVDTPESTPVYAEAGSDMPVGGVRETTGHLIDDSYRSEIRAKTSPKVGAAEYSVTDKEKQTNGNTDFSYNRLPSDKLKTMYSELDEAMLAFINTDDFKYGNFSSAELKKRHYLKLDSGSSYYYAFIVDFSPVSITLNELELVFHSYFSDNSRYFWVDQYNYLHTRSNKSLYVTIDRDYLSSSVRDEVQKCIDDVSAKWIYDISRYNSDYEKARFLHDIVCVNTFYSYDENGNPQAASWAHNLYGLMAGMGTVCEGYARAYQYILNRVGIDAVYVHGGSTGGLHAWNLIKLDGRYYCVDVTWDDINAKKRVSIKTDNDDFFTYDYFCLPYNDFKENHYEGTPDSTTGYGYFVSLQNDINTGLIATDLDHTYYSVYGCVIENKSETELLTKLLAAIDIMPGKFIFVCSEDISALSYAAQYVENKLSLEIIYCENRNYFWANGMYKYFILRIEPQSVEAPDTPVVMISDNDEIILYDDYRFEYSTDGKSWYREPLFTDLTADTEYSFYARQYSTPDTVQSAVSLPTVFRTTASSTVIAGQCGKSAVWSNDTNLGELFISGTGDTFDYGGDFFPPWNYFNIFRIDSVRISDGVESIGNYLLAFLSGVDRIVVPSSVSRIGSGAFFGCVGLDKVYLMAKNVEISCDGTVFPENAVIVGFAASGAGEYADSHSLQFEYVHGDINLDGEVNNTDILELLKYIYFPAGHSNVHCEAADTDSDGEITNTDVLRILAYIADPVADFIY